MESFVAPVQLLNGHKYNHPQGEMFEGVCCGYQTTRPLSYFWFFRSRVSPLSSDSLSMLLSVTRLTILSFTQTHKKDSTPLSLSSKLQQTGQPSNWSNWLGSGGEGHTSVNHCLTLVTDPGWE